MIELKAKRKLDERNRFYFSKDFVELVGISKDDTIVIEKHDNEQFIRIYKEK